jgi:hypothetical protein
MRSSIPGGVKPMVADKMILIDIGIAYLLDLALGDPPQFPHPVRLIGWLISRLEVIFRQLVTVVSHRSRISQARAERFFGIILALITWIPYFGQLFLSIMAIPAFFVCIFILYLVVVTLVSLVIGPSIVGTTGNDTFDTLFESFSVINDQPWRFITYEFLLRIVLVIGVVILGFFAAKAIFLCYTVIGIIVPADKLGNIFANAAYYVKLLIPPFYPESIQNLITGYVEWIGMPNLLFPPEYVSAYEGWAGAIASFILGIVYYFIILGVMSLGYSIYWAGNTLIFTVLVKKKDDKNLLEIKEEVFEEKKEEVKPEEKEEEKKPKKPRKKEEETEEKPTEPKSEEDK